MNKLNEKDMRILKENGLIAATDVVYMMGDPIIAEDLQSGTKRIIEAEATGDRPPVPECPICRGSALMASRFRYIEGN